MNSFLPLVHLLDFKSEQTEAWLQISAQNPAVTSNSIETPTNILLYEIILLAIKKVSAKVSHLSVTMTKIPQAINTKE